MRGTIIFRIGLVVLLLASLPQAQGPPPSALTVVSREGRKPLPTTVISGQELVALDDIATLLGVTVREDTLAGGVSVSYRGRSVVASPDQPMASVNGRVVALPAPIVRAGRRWLVPLEFLPRAIGPIYDQRIELRRQPRLLLVGDVRVPRVLARFEGIGPPTRLAVDVTPTATVNVTSDTSRVLLRVDADALDLTLPPASGGQIEQVRAGDQPNTLAIVLAGGSGTPRVSTTVADGATHLIIDVPAANAPPTETAAPRPPASTEAPLIPATPRSAVQIIVLDPGHGGEDVGVRGASGLEERQFTLDVARRLRGLIESRLGLRVVMTRDDDRAVGLDARAAIANNSKADLFLSLHANAALAPTVTGVETYYLKLGREGEEARREAAADAVVLPVVGGGTRALDIIRWDLAQARHVDASAKLAQILSEELAKQQLGMGTRPVQQAPLRVLEGADMPAALVEMGYLTNPEQEKLAGTDAYKNALAQGLYDAILRFRALADGQGTE